MEIEELEKIKINISENKTKLEFNAYTIDDRRFLEWFIREKLGSLRNKNRLKFRLLLLNSIKKDNVNNSIKRDKHGRFCKTN